MNPKLAMISAVVLILGAGVLTWIGGPKSKTSSQPDLTCAVIHEPAQGCPAGYLKEKKPRFVQKDGSHEYACVDQSGKKRHCINVLKPGEGMEFNFEIEMEPPVGGPKT